MLAANLGQPAEAERELNAALKLDSLDVPAMVNLADLMRASSREAECEAWLRRAMRADPRAAEPVFALALHEVRAGNHRGALELLRRAAVMDPANARYAYAYGIALHSDGQVDRAITTLSEAQRRHPSDREILTALVTMERDRGHFAAASGWASMLEDLDRP
jgi:Flp pilus assembly protein TadD